MGRLGPGGLRAAVAGVHQFSGVIRRRATRALPLVLFGHSWGSFMAQMILNEHAAGLRRRRAHRHRLSLARFLDSGDLNRKHKHLGTTGAEWLSRDPAVAAGVRGRPADDAVAAGETVRTPRRVAALRPPGEESAGAPPAARPGRRRRHRRRGEECAPPGAGLCGALRPAGHAADRVPRRPARGLQRDQPRRSDARPGELARRAFSGVGSPTPMPRLHLTDAAGNRCARNGRAPQLAMPLVSPARLH